MGGMSGIQTPNNKALPWYHFLIIKEKQKWKAMFDMLINILVAYNCVSITLSISFEVNSSGILKMFDDYFVEPMFGLDILFNFLMEFKDSETQQPVREFTLIAKNYMFGGSFLFDFLAIIPIKTIMGDEGTGSLNKILRMVRITRMLKLLDIARFNHSLKSFFENDSS